MSTSGGMFQVAHSTTTDECVIVFGMRETGCSGMVYCLRVDLIFCTIKSTGLSSVQRTVYVVPGVKTNFPGASPQAPHKRSVGPKRKLSE